jgi:hypothetical protein
MYFVDVSFFFIHFLHDTTTCMWEPMPSVIDRTNNKSKFYILHEEWRLNAKQLSNEFCD